MTTTTTGLQNKKMKMYLSIGKERIGEGRSTTKWGTRYSA